MTPRIVTLLLTIAAFGCAKRGNDPARSGDSTGATAPASPVSAPQSAAGDTGIIVNGVELSAETKQQLHQIYPVAIPPGRYWYDAISGGYGFEGEPIAGQILPGLSLGSLAADASGGTSGVFINGRQITNGEKLYIERLCQTPVVGGRYWVMATGVGGYEGQAAFFNLAQCPGVSQQNSGPRSMSRTWCDPNGACTSTGILWSITTAPQ